MGSDRARLSTDPGRGYRTVVQQQGRVGLEADGNEATRLAETQLRENVIDIVGPSGTPDDGYRISPVAGGGFQVEPGTYYLGGWRVTQDNALPLGEGPDDLDLPAPQLGDGAHVFALLLTEQEISAVEDRALLEVALGGPDTGQRTRLMQRVIALPAADAWCGDGATAINAALLSGGATLDPASAAILPSARLRVIPVAPPGPTDPCDPPAVGGYLGADNQLIRVSVIEFDPATGRGQLVWGYDNAATLYRVTTANGRTFNLQADPIDAAHAPQLNQAVEVLRTRARLGQGDVIAADAGLVSLVDQPYDPDLRRVRIADTVPAGARGDVDHPLFLRLWEEIVPFIAGDLTELGNTGLAVRVTLDALDEAIVARPYWCFAARPSTPLLVYPRRYLDAGQPPEGPRQWLAALAVGEVGRNAASNTGSRVTDDCRETFLPLTKIKPGCCGITLDPDMHGHRDFIQAALDRLRGTRGTVTLRPGHYRLRKPIVLDSSHKGLTLEGCAEGVFLEAMDESDPAFSAGLIMLNDVNEVHLRRLQLQLPVSPLLHAKINLTPGDDEEDNDIKSFIERLQGRPVSVGVNATGCAQLVIEECQFRFRLKPRESVFASGLLLRGECWGLTLRRNRFLHDDDFQRDDDYADLRLLFGVTLLPGVQILTLARAKALPEDARLDALLDDGDIYDNEFAGLTVAMLSFARHGTVRIERNHVHKCEGGIILLDGKMAATGSALGAEMLPGLELFLVMAIGRSAAIPGAVHKRLELAQSDFRAARHRANVNRRDLLDLLAGDQGNGNAEDDDEDIRSPIYRYLAVLVASVTGPLETHIHVANNAFDVLGQLNLGGSKGNFSDRPTSAAFDSSASVKMGNAGCGLPALVLAFEYNNNESSGEGDVLVASNRFRARSASAVVILMPEGLVFGSNLVRGHANDRLPTLNVIAARSTPMEIMGNVLNGNIRIEPSDRLQSQDSDWLAVNRAG
jgi:Family of unknown function (DUF6519)